MEPKHNSYTAKILALPDLQRLVAIWKKQNQKVVFTNGCFDLLHAGHVSYLQEAKTLGDKLVLGLNGDASISRLKGPDRPLQSEHDRAIILAALGCIDAVCIFHEDTPLNLIEGILPDVLVKGGDWSTDQIVGSKEVIQNGGTVHSLSFLQGLSTTNIIEKIIHKLKL